MKIQNPLQNSILTRYPEGHITQFFGENKELYLKAIGQPGHPGIDIYQPYGTDILAPYDGKISGVFFQEDNKIGGNQIDLFSDIQPDGLVYETIYAHCNKIVVQKGQRVKAGEKIGEVGNSGFVISGGIQYWQMSNPDNRGTHLHFGLRIWKPLRPGDMESLVIQNWDNGFHGWIDPMLHIERSRFIYTPLEDKNTQVDDSKLVQIYNEILLRDPDEIAKGYIGHDEEFVRAEVGKSEERQKIIRIVNLARMIKLI